jgi:hypothetical protein
VLSSKNNHARRAFQVKWLKEFKWLCYEEVAFCNVCKNILGLLTVTLDYYKVFKDLSKWRHLSFHEASNNRKKSAVTWT